MIKQVLEYLKHNGVILSVIGILLITLTISIIVIKKDAVRFRSLQDTILVRESRILAHEICLNEVLDATASIKGKYITDIKRRDSIINTLNIKLHEARNIYNPIIVSDDSVSLFISNNIHNKQ